MIVALIFCALVSATPVVTADFGQPTILTLLNGNMFVQDLALVKFSAGTEGFIFQSLSFEIERGVLANETASLWQGSAFIGSVTGIELVAGESRFVFNAPLLFAAPPSGANTVELRGVITPGSQGILTPHITGFSGYTFQSGVAYQYKTDLVGPSIQIGTPQVPEPATFGLLSLGLATFGVVRRRFRK